MNITHLIPPENEVTPGPELPGAAGRRPSVRRLVLIGTDGSRFRLVPGPSTLAPRRP
jgi:hypothetical protein